MTKRSQTVEMSKQRWYSINSGKGKPKPTKK